VYVDEGVVAIESMLDGSGNAVVDMIDPRGGGSYEMIALADINERLICRLWVNAILRGFDTSLLPQADFTMDLRFRGLSSIRG